MKARPLPQPSGPSPPAVPWAPMGGQGQGQGRAVDGGLWSPHCPGGISWSNCPEAPGLGLRHLKDFSAIYCSYC